MKKISIIIPVYNAEKYLKSCLDSIFNEVDENIEVIVINDGSTDDSLNICKKYEKIKIINQPNCGVSCARNKGIHIASGDYIMFVDSDDVLLKNWKNNLIDSISTNKDVYIFSKKYLYNKLDKSDLIKSFFVCDIPNYYDFVSSPWSKLYNRSFLISNNILFNEEIINGEDLLFNLKCIILSNTLSSSNKSIYSYRISMNSSTKKFNDLIFKSDKKFYNVLNEWLIAEKTNLNENEISYLKNYTLKNNIYLIAIRLAYSKKYSIFIKYSNKFDYYFNNITANINIGFIQGLIVFLIKNKFYYFVYLLLRIKIYKMSKKNEKLIEI